MTHQRPTVQVQDEEAAHDFAAMLGDEDLRVTVAVRGLGRREGHARKPPPLRGPYASGLPR